MFAIPSTPSGAWHWCRRSCQISRTWYSIIGTLERSSGEEPSSFGCGTGAADQLWIICVLFLKLMVLVLDTSGCLETLARAM